MGINRLETSSCDFDGDVARILMLDNLVLHDRNWLHLRLLPTIDLDLHVFDALQQLSIVDLKLLNRLR